MPPNAASQFAGRTLREAAPAKVNLFLHVTGRRADGYHLLDSLAVFPPVGDRVLADRAAALSLTVKGAEAASLTGTDDNLVMRAARALAAHAGIRPAARLTLDKRLPVASGIGGGSADAAAALRVLSRLWALPAGTIAELAVLAESLGADCPVCLQSEAARMGGIGEVLTPAPTLPPFGLALVNPRIAVATPAVFAARGGAFSSPANLPAAWPDAVTMAADLRTLGNDLEAPAAALCPPIADVLNGLRAAPGCLLARMSGSGATCFGLFATSLEAARAAVSLRGRGWWWWGGTGHEEAGHAAV